MFRKK